MTMSASDNLQDLPPPYSPSDPNGASPPALPPRLPAPTRSASSSALLPVESAPSQEDGRRKLLLIYIHGFMGNETSFQSFPVHIHNMVSVLVSQTHVVQTKIYPKYRSKKAIDVAVHDFSEWLIPHESPDTDLVLLGHSMGGLLTAELALMPTSHPNMSPLMHRLVGTISFDTPFLGMHPGIIPAGFSSLFRTDPQAAPAPESEPSGWPLDPNFNPPFFNDIQLPVRNAWRNAAHFVNKHSNQLRTATKQLIVSHIEFGQCLADFDGLKVRYCRIRILEEEDKNRRQGVVESAQLPPRVRFVNYYTASTGRPKQQQTPSSSSSRSESVNTFNEVDVPLERGPPAMIEKQPIPIADESDEESIVSELTELDPLDDVESHFDDAASIIDTPSERLASLDDTESIDTLPSFHDLSDVPSESGYPAEKSRGQAPTPTMSLKSQSTFIGPLRSPETERRGDSLTLSPQFVPEEGPEPPGPIPLPEDYNDYHYYRAILSEHGKRSKLYFQKAKEHYTQQYEQYVSACKAQEARITSEMNRLTKLRAAERSQWHQAHLEHARIMFEMRAEERQSRIDHQKAIAEYQGLAAKESNPDSKSQQQKHGKMQLKLDEQRLKMDRKFEKGREKMAKHQRKVEKQEEKNARKLQKRVNSDGGSITSSSTDRTLFDAEGTDGNYDLNTAPISKSIRPIGNMSMSTTSLSSTNSLVTPPSTSSQLSLDSAVAEPSRSGLQSSLSAIADATKPLAKPAKDKVFCILPPADASGNRDPCWVRVYMENIDEVGAHTGLFFSRGAGEAVPEGQEWSRRYTKLVVDVAERIEQWVTEDLNRRVAEAVE